MSYQHWFVTWNTRSSYGIYKYIKYYNFVFLQETTEDSLESLTERLNLSHKTGFYKNIYDGNRNGIVTNLFVVDYTIGTLDVGYGTEEDKYIQIKVDLSRTDSGDASNYLKLMCFQLDKNSEETRMDQVKLIEEKIKDSDVILGNLNSLHFADYTPSQMDNINQIRIKNEQEIVKTSVMNYLTSINYEPREFIGNTCSHKTRIDYVLLNQNKNISCLFNEIIIPKTKKNTHSKHYLVVFLIHKGGRKFYL